MKTKFISLVSMLVLVFAMNSCDMANATCPCIIASTVEADAGRYKITIRSVGHKNGFTTTFFNMRPLTPGDTIELK